MSELYRKDLHPINTKDLTSGLDYETLVEENNKDMDMDQEIQQAFNDTVGEILNYLDEANCSFTLKKAVKSALYELCDKKIKPLGLGAEYGTEDSAGNR